MKKSCAPIFYSQMGLENCFLAKTSKTDLSRKFVHMKNFEVLLSEIKSKWKEIHVRYAIL